MDLLNCHFGHLKVVGNSSRKGYVICKCYNCGNFKEIRATSLTKKKDPTISCGCIQKEIASTVGFATVKKNTNKQVTDNKAYHTNFGSIKCVKPKNNSSGCKGVSWNKERQKWEAYLGLHGKTIRLGYFDDLADAIAVRKEAEETYYKPVLEKAGRT